LDPNVTYLQDDIIVENAIIKNTTIKSLYLDKFPDFGYVKV